MNNKSTTSKKKYTLRKGLEIMLEFSKDNKDNKAKAKFMAKQIYKHFNNK